MSTAKKTKSPLRREDRAGHLDPAHAASLRAKSEETKTHDANHAFVGGTKTKDVLAEELAEEAVVAMTSGEEDLPDDLNAEVAEEAGGPFVHSTTRVELAEGAGGSNPRAAKREPIPKT